MASKRCVGCDRAKRAERRVVALERLAGAAVELVPLASQAVSLLERIATGLEAHG